MELSNGKTKKTKERKINTKRVKRKTNTYSVTLLGHPKNTFFTWITFQDKVFWSKASFSPTTLHGDIILDEAFRVLFKFPRGVWDQRLANFIRLSV